MSGARDSETPERSTPTTRERILDAASAELARADYAGARMETIAEGAGIRKQGNYLVDLIN